ncbi:hypothetical protein AWC14_19350 [Mycobacterium kyorinense]|uniref:Uncharacterized protein n=1 Tax=Mycobacterium kyorinense TaxID=487514 RepID=A0A1X1YJ39_9MYCO|nr:hypothetical protein AWC14_19350 [Mycobacterium kyorinense]SPX88517.1 Uncharacterised protein [Mycobacterium xenopi]
MLGLGKHSAVVRAINMGSTAVGESLRSTPEFGAAMSLVAALNDPQRPGSIVLLGGWSCAVFGSGVSARFVVAERHGLSWIPAGVYLPGGVTVAHLDGRVPAETRLSWRGMEPSALVLSRYSEAVGEQPRIVVAREYCTALDGWFDRRTVLVADKGERVVIPNPVTDPAAGHHRLALASPTDWAHVQSLADGEIQVGIRWAAEELVKRHNEFFAEEADARLRLTALSHIGRWDAGGPPDVRSAVGGKMREILPRLVGCPEFGREQHNLWVAHQELEMQLRGWETLWLAFNEATRTTLADVMYAYRMATEPILPIPEIRAEAV